VDTKAVIITHHFLGIRLVHAVKITIRRLNSLHNRRAIRKDIFRRVNRQDIVRQRGHRHGITEGVTSTLNNTRIFNKAEADIKVSVLFSLLGCDTVRIIINWLTMIRQLIFIQGDILSIEVETEGITASQLGHVDISMGVHINIIIRVINMDHFIGLCTIT
jgi:hypothetical protein